MNERKEAIVVNYCKNEDGKVVVEPDRVMQRWKNYMKRLLNIENDWNGFDGENVYEGLKKLVTEAEVLTAIGQLVCNKVGGPTGLVGNIFKVVGIAGAKAMIMLCNKILFEGNITSDWELSILLPIYKGKMTH